MSATRITKKLSYQQKRIMLVLLLIFPPSGTFPHTSYQIVEQLPFSPNAAYAGGSLKCQRVFLASQVYWQYEEYKLEGQSFNCDWRSNVASENNNIAIYDQTWLWKRIRQRTPTCRIVPQQIGFRITISTLKDISPGRFSQTFHSARFRFKATLDSALLNQANRLKT